MGVAGRVNSHNLREISHLAWHLTPAAARCSRYCHQNDLNEESLFVEESSPPNEFAYVVKQKQESFDGGCGALEKIGKNFLVDFWG